MTWPTFPVVYEINTWVWLQNLSRQANHDVTLGNVPDAELDRLAGYGFDAIWLMGVWERSASGRRTAQEHFGLRADCRSALPDYTPADVVGSPYAVHSYRVDRTLGGDAELDALRQRLRQVGLPLILDFVPNHLARDHAWLFDHPERFIRGDSDSLVQDPANYFTADNGRVFAHGRDPNFPAWTDTVQLDYRRSDTRQAMSDLLLAVAERCDGVRCDMAMLVTQDAFLRTWGGTFDLPNAEFWPTAITNAKARHHDLLLVAEVYWDLEAKLQQMGFDYTYDKSLYDLLLGEGAGKVRARLRASLEYQRHLVRFIENHDEKRALEAFGDPQRSRAAATLALNLPGMRLIHDGQLEGYRLKLPVQLRRRQPEPTDTEMERFYRRLLSSLHNPVFHSGQWRLLTPQVMRPQERSHDDVIAYQWVMGKERRLILVNVAPRATRCLLPLEMPELAGNSWRLRDLLSDLECVRNGDDLGSRGLLLDLTRYGYHLFEVVPQ